MPRTALTVKGYVPEDIKELLSSDQSFVIAIRLFLVYQIARGYSSRQFGEIHGISFKQITTWVHRFEDGGLEGLKDRPGRGRKSQLSKKDLQKIKIIVLKESPADHGYSASRWTAPLLSDWIEKNYGVKYQRARVYNLLRGIGIEFYKQEGLVKIKV